MPLIGCKVMCISNNGVHRLIQVVSLTIFGLALIAFFYENGFVETKIQENGQAKT